MMIISATTTLKNYINIPNLTELLLEHLWTLMKIPEKFKNLIYQNHFLKIPELLKNPYNDKMQRILVITTDKLIPTKYVKNSSFNPDLKNGVDISYYSEFYADNESELEFYIVDKKRIASITDYGETIPYLENLYPMISI